MWVRLIVILLCFSSCGYQFQGSSSILPPDVRRVYIPLAENNSTEPRMSVVVTEALRDRFERFGVVSVVDEEKDADAVLRTKIAKFKRESNTVASKTDTSLQETTTLTLASELRRITGPILWRNPQISVTKVFSNSASSVVTTSADFASGGLSSGDIGNLSTRELSRGQEQQALLDLAELAARRIYDDAVASDF